jgi:hypothetical protein
MAVKDREATKSRQKKLPNVSFEILETISSIYAFWAAKTVDRPA